MKTLIFNTFLLLSFNTIAGTNPFALVGKPITSPMKDQVCHIKINGDEAVCSGIRISKDYVLTAQHCARTNNKVNSLVLTCNDRTLEIAKVLESTQYNNGTSINNSQIDFALIKISQPTSFTPKVKLLKNLAEYKSILLNSTDTKLTNFSERTYCEIHGYGTNEKKQLDKYKSVEIYSTTKFKDQDHLFKVTLESDTTATIDSPVLPEKYTKSDWTWSSARPGDSGGPLVCLTKSKEWILAGITSTLSFDKCPEKYQEKKKSMFRADIQCHGNTWGVPSKETLEAIFKISLD